MLGKGNKKRCSITDVLQHYKAVIFEEIQILKNLTGPTGSRRRGRGKTVGLPCRSDKEQKILLSIYTMGLSLRREVASTQRNPLGKTVLRVAVHTESVIKENCRRIHQQSQKQMNKEQKKPVLSTEPPKPQEKGSQKRRLKQMVERFAACWEKLYSLHSRLEDTPGP
ncbi:uncharacterized protein C20orf204 homolog isoform X2 [Ornithorhynchus anatinus]|nr:uncharacterized protein C20orf204 homolog isoform X2 [Ornithorhynchus anatinus]